MKRKYIHMCMLIQGPTQPVNDISLYLQLLDEELDALWANEGVNTWDTVVEDYFPIRFTLITTVRDYLPMDISWVKFAMDIMGVLGKWIRRHMNN
jgi:hypothetical protein